MSQIPMGKVLFRNLLRHTGAHNKILEESEMWKQRDMEKHSSDDQVMLHGRKPAHMYRGHMHCDRFLEETSASGDRDREDDREARFLTRKIYEIKASDPNRWGHSGFKELYPEEFESGGEKEGSNGENLQLRKRRRASLGARDTSTPRSPPARRRRKRRRRRGRKAGSENSGRARRAAPSPNTEPHKKKRKDWKAANEENSEESSED
ncbi:hypothetical protein ANANG_G00233310 [Anguilla anguilla]|uniref:Uncharacterized protein n=1 Tax=Anguilla anguilla TaxID=7936 RepID=A0A9D3M1R2_ANGAN|nr:hypothetical protein ANANG_G00233310 [Anguilla anguilla]